MKNFLMTINWDFLIGEVVGLWLIAPLVNWLKKKFYPNS
jgi:hypothetical protein